MVVTGAGSAVGQQVVAHLSREAGVEIDAWISARPGQHLPPPSQQCSWRAVDLARPLPPAAVASLSRCDVLLHLAWVRCPQAARAASANIAMIRNLTQHLRDPAALRVISSVSSGPRARSAYGKAKYAANQLIMETGGAALLLGLIIEANPNSGPYRMLRDVVRGLPVQIRFVDCNPNVYPIRDRDAMRMIVAFALRRDLSGLYQGFSPPLGINRFLALLEQAHPRVRLPLPLLGIPLQALARVVSSFRLPGSAILDKVATILHKDDDYLLSAPTLPVDPPERCEGPEFFARG